ncbi:transcriptional regulator [Lacrimispora defluvii]|uniref:Transcriptional regulator n=1 Tax=Lacrimispora defluvii TaxID=2719233 RepID=A0ABX1VJR6_9FIRM|nr:transcriptional regulator [Lacrimispora defluvii]NNJ28498.1 transcriptional regulator [Lacrimispora defluvii]
MGNVIKQTNRTLLMEVINPEKLDLLTLVGDVRGVESLSDDKIKEINDHLMVRSFDELLEKFAPTVYCYYNANNQRVVYQLDKPEQVPDEMLTEIPLNRQNEFMGMLMSMVETKRSEGTINVDFKFEKLTDMISPKKVMDAIKQNRKELQYTYGEYAKLDEEDPKKRDLGDKLNVMFEEASANYNNVMALLPLAIEDIKTRLLLGDGGDKKDNTPLALGVLSMGDQGELRVLEAPKVETTALTTIDDNVNTGLIEALKDDYQALNEESNDYVGALVARTFCPLSSTMESSIDIATEVSNYNSYLEFYKESKDAFIKTVKPLIERLLGIWCYFEQYPKKLKGMRPSMLVTNVSNEMLAKSSNIPRLITYLTTVNAKNDFTNTVWYAVVPNVSLDQNSKMKLTRERFKGNSKAEKNDTNSVESLIRLLDVFKDYKVQCFFSYEADDSTTFNALATEGITRYEDRCAALMGKEFSEFAIPCLPNYTIIPKDKSGVVLDSRMVVGENQTAELSKEKEDIMKLWIDGVYVGAAYVAAGVVAACQCPEYLKSKFGPGVRLDMELPGVRFDIEADDHSLIACTTMAKEITGFTNSIKNDINRKNFGFIFSSENASYKGTNITKIMVYKARNLMSDGSMFEPIYKTQVTTYIERVMRHGTGDFKEDSIVQFFSNNPNSQKSQWLSRREYINGVLGAGDDISCSINEETGYCTLDITFNGNVKNLEVEINRLSANKA